MKDYSTKHSLINTSLWQVRIKFTVRMKIEAKKMRADPLKKKKKRPN